MSWRIDYHRLYTLVVNREIVGKDFLATLKKTLVLPFPPCKGCKIVWKSINNREVKISLDELLWYDYNVDKFFWVQRVYRDKHSIKETREELSELILHKEWDEIKYE